MDPLFLFLWEDKVSLLLLWFIPLLFDGGVVCLDMIDTYRKLVVNNQDVIDDDDKNDDDDNIALDVFVSFFFHENQ